MQRTRTRWQVFLVNHCYDWRNPSNEQNGVMYCPLGEKNNDEGRTARVGRRPASTALSWRLCQTGFYSGPERLDLDPEGAAMQQIAERFEKFGMSEYAKRFADKIDVSALRHLTQVGEVAPIFFWVA
jgi:hypothetical protein